MQNVEIKDQSPHCSKHVLAPVRVFHGDCLEIMKHIPNGSIDMILCDLPYGTTACKWDIIIPFDKLWEQYERVIKPNGAIVLFGNEPFSSNLRLSNMKDYKYDWKWDKKRGSNFATVKIRPFNSFEDIMIFYKNQPTYNPQMEAGKPYTQKQGFVGEAKQTGLKRKEVITINKGERYPLSILRFSKESGLHPTQKPIPLFEYLIKTYTKEGDLVLDNCAGSGTTAIACTNTNRNCILIEKEKQYFDIINERIAKHTLNDQENFLLKPFRSIGAVIACGG